MNNIVDKRTKIITTIGPSSDSKEIMSRLFDAGMTTIRLNFSHGKREEQKKRIDLAREISKERNIPISVMLDTKGPEIRIGKFKTGKKKIKENENVIFYTDNDSYLNKVCDKNDITVSYDMSKDLSPGKIILVDDGKLSLAVKKISSGLVEAVALNEHVIKENKRINLPGIKFSMPFLSERDIEDIKFGVKNGIDFIAASFVNTPEDVKQIKSILKKEKKEYIKVIAKIESQYAVDNFDEIIKIADGAMVARGDLGLEIPYYDVPVFQKMMIRKSRELGKPIIIATQMLDSMENNPTPTRAEVMDVYIATEEGADATMLSGESAAGKYPVEAVRVMSKINLRAEKEFNKKLYYKVSLAKIRKNSYGERTKIADEVAQKAINGDFRFAIVFSETGKLLSEISRFRPNVSILGVTGDKNQITQFGITANVFMFPSTKDFKKMKKDHSLTLKVAKNFGAKLGDKFLVIHNNKIGEYIVK